MEQNEKKDENNMRKRGTDLINKNVVERQTEQIVGRFHKLPSEVNLFEFADWLKVHGL